MPTVLHCLCSNNLDGCPACAERAREKWRAFAARHAIATAGELLEQAIRQDQAEAVLGALHQLTGAVGGVDGSGSQHGAGDPVNPEPDSSPGPGTGHFDINQPCEATRYGSVSPLMTALRAGSVRTLALIAGQPGFDLTRSLPEFDSWRWVRDASPLLLRQFLNIPGSKVNQPDANGKTLLHEAVDTSTSPDTLRELLGQPGIDIEGRQFDGTTALYRAGLAGNRTAFDLLLAQDAEPNNRNADNQWTVLMCAVAQGREAIVDALRRSPSLQVNAADDYQNTALHLAAQRGHVEIVEFLLGHPDVQVNLRNHLGLTALSQAAVAGHGDVLRRLLGRSELDVNAVDTQSQTALFHAVSAGQTDSVRLLLADPRTDTGVRSRPDQLCAFDVAEALGLIEIVELMRTSGGLRAAPAAGPAGEPRSGK